ncbi:MAG: 5-oxoprolinase subunit PxpB [Clostridia bacterium]|nr:5-oxoprolinase subunit PxpB [Clostridia bacterium]MBQ7046732.1 5-oxoprolinase subunit PxpB [Oscillospiraceae bacterium]
MKDVVFLPVGDSAISVEFGRNIDSKINKRIRSLSDSLRFKPVRGVTECVPTFRSLLVCYNPEQTGYDTLVRKLKKRLSSIGDTNTNTKRVFHIPVCYGGEFGEDIGFVSSHTGLSENEIIDLHTGRDYLIFMLGFLPGFAYLGDMDSRLFTPRLSNPRTSIPAGSVGIGGEQTGIYPLASPGGWQLIGRTPVRPYDPDRESPILYAAGDYVRFFAVCREEYDIIESKVKDGSYICNITETTE